MKRYYFVLLVLLTIFFVPKITYAKTYNLDDFYYPDMYSETVIINTFEKGDVLDFSDITDRKYYLIIEGHNSNKCYGNFPDCETTYTFVHKTIYSSLGGGGEYINFLNVDENTNIISFDDLVEGHLYKSGDIIVFPHRNFSMYYYDEKGNEYKYDNGEIANRIFPFEDQDAYWKLSFVDDGQYAPVSLVFEVFPYKAPEFSISCEKNTINYGDKTKCTVFVDSRQQLKKVSFSLDIPNFNVSNVKAADHVNSFDGPSQYNFLIDSGYGVENVVFSIMTFELEGTKNESYVDNIKIVDISYVDDLFEGNYKEVENNLKIIPNKLNNPKTYGNLIFVLLPIFILLISFIIYKDYERKKLHNSN